MSEINDKDRTPAIDALLSIIEENVLLRENYDALKVVYNRLEESNAALGKRFDVLITEIKSLRARIAELEEQIAIYNDNAIERGLRD